MLTMLLTMTVSTVHAAPMSLLHTGRLLDSTGMPLNGSITLTASLHTAQEDGSLLWTGANTAADIQDGYYAIALTNGTPSLDSSVFAVPGVWVEVSANGVSMSRTRLHSVPYALEAATARGVPMVTSQPASCVDGEIHFDTSASALRVCDGGAWTPIAAQPPSLDCTCAQSSVGTGCGVNDVTATLSTAYTRTGGGCHSNAANERQIMRSSPTGNHGWNCRSTDEDNCRAETLYAYSCGCRLQ